MNRLSMRRLILAAALLTAACDDNDGMAAPTNSGDCPTDGGDMARLPEGFCIDRTEVTRGVYFAWLDAGPSIADQPTQCTGNADFTPACFTTDGWAPDRYTENPVSCVDWCDARAFCESHGKRLCGRIGGGASPIDSYDDPEQNEWFAACTSGGENDYVYGDDYVLHACVETLRETWGSGPAGEFTQCVSPDPDYAGVFDLSGHLAEWEDSCDGDSADARCRLRGGSFQHEGNGTRCDAGRTLSFPRAGTSDAVGFRCCAD